MGKKISESPKKKSKHAVDVKKKKKASKPVKVKAPVDAEKKKKKQRSQLQSMRTVMRAQNTTTEPVNARAATKRAAQAALADAAVWLQEVTATEVPTRTTAAGVEVPRITLKGTALYAAHSAIEHLLVKLVRSAAEAASSLSGTSRVAPQHIYNALAQLNCEHLSHQLQIGKIVARLNRATCDNKGTPLKAVDVAAVVESVVGQ